MVMATWDFPIVRGKTDHKDSWQIAIDNPVFSSTVLFVPDVSRGL